MAYKAKPSHFRWVVLGLFLFFFIYLFIKLQLFNQEQIKEYIAYAYSLEISFAITLLSTILLVFFVPISWVTVATSIILGYYALFVVLIAGLLSALISYAIARLFKKDVSRFLNRRYFTKRIDTLEENYQKINDTGFANLLFLRLFPAIPFGIGNYLFSLSFMNLRTFFTVTALSILIAQGINVYLVQQLIEIQEHPLEAVLAVLVKIAYLLIIFAIAKQQKGKRKKTKP